MTDLTAMSARVKGLNEEADKMSKSGHTHSHKIRSRQQQLNDNWQRIQKLKVDKDENLANAQR